MQKTRLIGVLVAALLTIAVAILAPYQLGVTLYKLSLVTVAGVVGYWLDRIVFHYARPDRCSHDDRPAAMIRRAIVMAACIVGVGLGA